MTVGNVNKFYYFKVTYPDKTIKNFIYYCEVRQVKKRINQQKKEKLEEILNVLYKDGYCLSTKEIDLFLKGELNELVLIQNRI